MGQRLRDEHGELEMNDIVETLREESKFAASNPYERCDHEELLNQAAGEIERLRADVVILTSMAKFKERT